MKKQYLRGRHYAQISRRGRIRLSEDHRRGLERVREDENKSKELVAYLDPFAEADEGLPDAVKLVTISTLGYFSRFLSHIESCADIPVAKRYFAGFRSTLEGNILVVNEAIAKNTDLEGKLVIAGCGDYLLLSREANWDAYHNRMMERTSEIKERLANLGL